MTLVEIPIKVELGNGFTAAVVSATEANIKLNKFSAYTFREKFTILYSSFLEILLESSFINHQDVMIAYFKCKIRIVNQVLLLSD